MKKEVLDALALSKYPIAEQAFKSTIGDSYETIDLNEKPRKAFIEGYNLASEDFEKKNSISMEQSYSKGYKSAMSKLPTWKKAERDLNSDTLDFAMKYTMDGGDYSDYEIVIATNRIKEGEYYVELSDLENLLIKE